MSVTITWDGTIQGFPQYRDAVEGFYTQEHSGYLFNPQFQKLYVDLGTKAANSPQLPQYISVTEKDVYEAAMHMYGAIQTSCRASNTAKKFLKNRSDSRDGILVWIDLCLNQDNDGNIEVREAKLEAKTCKKYHQGYKGGLIQYLEDVCDGYAGLEEIGSTYSERQKMQTLLNNLEFDHSDMYLVTHC